jgi:hypothetical protein
MYFGPIDLHPLSTTMDHDTIDTMAFYRSDEASFETHDTIDALNTESLNRLILTALFDCFLIQFPRCLDVTAHAPWQLRR